MRRVLSVLFLAIGGWMLAGEPLMAFVDMKVGSWVMLLMMLVFIVIAAVPLGIGVALSPGNRRRELGLTILIALGVTLISLLSIGAMLLDPGFKQIEPLMPPLPDVAFAPLPGLLNLTVVAAVGWWLFRKERRTELELPSAF